MRPTPLTWQTVSGPSQTCAANLVLDPPFRQHSQSAAQSTPAGRSPPNRTPSGRIVLHPHTPARRARPVVQISRSTRRRRRLAPPCLPPHRRPGTPPPRYPASPVRHLHRPEACTSFSLSLQPTPGALTMRSTRWKWLAGGLLISGFLAFAGLFNVDLV